MTKKDKEEARTGRPRMPEDARKRARSINLSPRADDALQLRVGPAWGPTQACSAMVERYLEAMDHFSAIAHPATADLVERVLGGRYLEATDIAVLPALASAAGEVGLAKDLAKLNYYQLCAIVDAVERRRADKD